ncbi:hypothetical protein DVS77_26160 [Mycolicibacterium moriokaense]|nr:hypothetical protein DVS77_26160 [Mycolicibacterium moriokaense]
MRLVAESGLWSTGMLSTPTPLLAVLEVSGAVLSWTVDDKTAAATITFTDLERADWLWRVLGESGHAAVAAAVVGRSPRDSQSIDVGGVDVSPGSLDQLRRLALGHWLRRWWPASHRDGIVALDGALVDAEIAVITTAAQDFFADDTFDSDASQLLAPHYADLAALARSGDPRVVELVHAAAALTDDDIAAAEPAQLTPRRDDYALAAGADRTPSTAGAVAQGTDSLAWAAVPPGVFDAAEDTIDWLVVADGQNINALVGVELSGGGSPSDIAVRLVSGPLSGAGTLDGRGRARFAVLDAAQQPLSESAAWNHDWRATTVAVGAEIEEPPQTRQRVRDFARARLAQPADDAFLAEILAAESDY